MIFDHGMTNDFDYLIWMNNIWLLLLSSFKCVAVDCSMRVLVTFNFAMQYHMQVILSLCLVLMELELS